MVTPRSAWVVRAWVHVMMIGAAAIGFVACAEPSDLSRARQGVVRVLAETVRADGTRQFSAGVGVLVSTDGVILTKAHVVREAVNRRGRVAVVFANQASALTAEFATFDAPPAVVRAMAHAVAARVVWMDAETDLAALAAASVDGIPIPVADSGGVRDGDAVSWVDFPGHEQLESGAALVTMRVASGIVERESSSISTRGDIPAHLLKMNDGSPHDDGGAVVSSCGTLVGLASFAETGDAARGEPAPRQAFAIANTRTQYMLDLQLLPYVLAPSRCGFVVEDHATLMVAVGGVAVLAGAAWFVWPRWRASRVGRRAASDRVPTVVSLACVEGEYAGEAITLGAEPVAIGTDASSCQLVFLGPNPTVSPRHCQVSAVSGRAELVDLGSTHGTFLADGRRIDAGRPQPLSVDDTFSLGDGSVRFRIQLGPGNV